MIGIDQATLTLNVFSLDNSERYLFVYIYSHLVTDSDVFNFYSKPTELMKEIKIPRISKILS